MLEIVEQVEQYQQLQVARENTRAEVLPCDDCRRDTPYLAMRTGSGYAVVPLDARRPPADSGKTPSQPAAGNVIFSENFDDLPDWQPSGRCLYPGYAKDCDKLPGQFDTLYTDDANPTHAPCYIEAAAARGGSGKGYHHWDESRGDNRRWKAECQLGARLPGDYQSLWFSLWIRINPDAEWEGGSESTKLLRGGVFNSKVMDGTARTTMFRLNNSSSGNRGLGRTTGGIFFVNFVRHSHGPTRLRLSTRCNPVYKCGGKNSWSFLISPENAGGGSDWKDNLGDGQWHHIEVHMAMNSSPGARDGILAVYYDGREIGRLAKVPWRMQGAEAWIKGINGFFIAGNSENVWRGNIDSRESPEQSFYFLDDIQVCKTRCSQAGKK